MLAKTSRIVLIAILLLLVAVGAAVGAVLAGPGLAPLRLVTRYSWQTLAAEATAMVECAECHDTSQMHACTTCHDEHGSAALAAVPFNQLLLLTGDVPEPRYIPTNDILPYREQPGTHAALLDVLARYGVQDFESVALAATDGGLVTVERQYLTPEALLLPYTDGVRFAAENLHVSSWLKGITRIIIVGSAKPLTIDGQATSIGRLLLGPLTSVTVEQTEVLFQGPADGQVRKAKTAARVEGAPVPAIVARPGFQTLRVRDTSGREQTFKAEEVRQAVLAPVHGQVTLVLPGRGRSQWVAGVAEIRSEE